MRAEVELKICLEDYHPMSGDQAIEQIFALIKQATAAIEAKEGKVYGYRYSNIPDKYENPRGFIATIHFDVGTRYVYEEYKFEVTLVQREFPAPILKDDQPSIWFDWKITLQKPTKDSKTT